MAGALLHLAMGDLDKLDPDNSEYSDSYKKAYALGLLLPDIAKQGFVGSIEDFNRYFEGCSQDDILTYEEFLQFSKNNHFNPDQSNPTQQDTRNPNLREFIDTRYVDLKKPIWQGVLCHLMGDKAFYYKTYCVDDPRAMEDYAKEVGKLKEWDGEKWRNSETGKVYYDDYNVLNQCIEDEYGVLDKLRRILPAPLVQELQENFKVKFSRTRTEPEYMNLKNIRKYINHSHLLIKGIESGNVENILQFFDGKDKEKIYDEER